ncbi:MAG: two-component regulator propeller domain-containing protein [Acidobacteriota bacterium]
MTPRLRATLPATALAALVGATAVSGGIPRVVRLRVLESLVQTSDVHAVAVAKTGVWLATTGGLVRLQGEQETRFSSLDGLPPGRLHALLTDGPDALWVGGDGGLVRLRVQGAAVAVTRRVPLREARSLARYQGALYCGTWGEGLLRIAPDSDRVGRLAAAASPWLDQVTSLAVGTDGLYLGTARGGVARFDGHRVQRFPAAQLPGRIVWGLAALGGEVWVATSGGLALLKGMELARAVEVSAAQRLAIRDLRAVLVDQDGALLLGSYGGGLFRLAGDTLSRVGGVPAAAHVWALSRHGEDLLIGTANGLLRRAPDDRTTRWSSAGPPANDIAALAVGREDLWVGTFDAGLSRYRAGRWRHFGRGSGVIDDRINHLALQPTGGTEVLWVATPRGVSRWSGGSWQSFAAGDHLAPGHVNAMHVSRGAVTFASSGGLARFDGARWERTTTASGLPVRQPTSVVSAADGTLWVGGIDGLARRDTSGRWTLFDTASGHLPDDWITALLLDGEGLWAGTYDGGIVYRGKGSARMWREADGLPCGWINPQAMLRAYGQLWLGTLDGGLLVGDDSGWRSFGISDGLPSLDVTAIAPAPDGTLWIATRAGLVRVRPAFATEVP